MSRVLDELASWLERVSAAEWVLHLKYLSANDTYAKRNVHQGGPYLGKDLLRLAFPALTQSADEVQNPDIMLPVQVVSHRLLQDIRLIWYNSRRLEGRSNGRDEARMTNWGGRDHPLLRESATGSLVMFAFHRLGDQRDADGCELWVCDTAEEEDAILALTGQVEPGRGLVLLSGKGVLAIKPPAADAPCTLGPAELRPEWRDAFPTGDDILEMVLHRMPNSQRLAVDERLIRRRACEYELFLSIENHVVLPRVSDGFASVEEFVSLANSVTNRRKSRAGKSLELQARAIFNEEDVKHSWTPETEDKRTPDFIFPSIEHYRDGTWPEARLRMLAAKTTCKDRWRQILNEAARVPVKHLLTLQEGVSDNQFREMQEEGVRLVVPLGLHDSYPESVRPELISFERFIRDARSMSDRE